MAKSKQHNKKPGIKDVVKVVSSLIQEVQIAQERINELYGVIDMYIEFKKDDKKFKKHLDKQLEEFKINDNKANESIDGGDTDGDKEDAGIRSEGIRA
jgi:competence protein ComGC